MKRLLVLAACAAPKPLPAPAPAPVPAPVARSSGPRWIGVAMAPGTTKIENVFAGSPASDAGLEIGDELVSVDGVAVQDAMTLRQQLVSHPDGAKVPLVIRRDGRERTVRIVAAPMPSTDELARALIGKPAPTFVLEALDGSSIDLAALRGKPVLLDFWATWCGPCEAMRPRLDAIAAQHPSVVVIGLSSEAPAAQHTYVAHHPIAHPLAIDVDGKVQLAYLADKLPTLVQIDEAGTVRAIVHGLGGLEQLQLP